MRVLMLDAWRSVYDGNARQVILPGEDGEVCVLDFHQPFLYRLRRGAVQISERDPAAASRFRIQRGIARMTGNQLVLLVET